MTRKSQRSDDTSMTAESARRVLEVLNSFKRSASDSNQRTTCSTVIDTAMRAGAVTKNFLMQAGVDSDTLDKIRRGKPSHIEGSVRESIFARIEAACNNALA
jgi:hypothetical protein